MCLSRVYVASNGEKELLMEEVASVEIGEGRLLLKTLFGEEKEIEGSISQIDLVTHTIILRRAG